MSLINITSQFHSRGPWQSQTNVQTQISINVAKILHIKEARAIAWCNMTMYGLLPMLKPLLEYAGRIQHQTTSQIHMYFIGKQSNLDIQYQTNDV
jgi:hypothetical protein